MMKRLILLFIFFAESSYADNFIRDSYMCMQYFSYYEAHYGLPKKLLNSVALIESGRYHKEYKRMLPWPWAVNQGGKPFYFEKKQDAIEAVAKMIESGISNIDVGCMQVNIGFHGENFRDLEHAFDPRVNVKFAAGLLAKHYSKHLSWKSAIAAYHSYSEKGLNYYHKVENLWKKQMNNNDELLETTTVIKSANKLPMMVPTNGKKSPERLRSSLVVH